jgi:hypothetical protein
MNADAKVERHPSRIAFFFHVLAERRRLILVIAILAITIGTLLKRDWLLAAGVAPALIGLLPCAAMCALGLCMGGKKEGGGSCHADEPDQTNPPQAKKERSENEPGVSV